MLLSAFAKVILAQGIIIKREYRRRMENGNDQVKSKQRFADYGEVFTGEREVDVMLHLVKY